MRLLPGLILFWVCLSAYSQEVDLHKNNIKNSYSERLELFVQRALDNHKGDEEQVVRLCNGGSFIADAYSEKSLDKLNNRLDCADFRVATYLRLLYLCGDNENLPEDKKREIEEALLNFKYWPDEKGIDNMCYWSENHHILFSSGGYLAGQLYPDSTFVNSGLTGKEMMEKFRPIVSRWLDLRYKTGFSEWLSNVYYAEDLSGVLNLANFSNDTVIARKATMVTDVILLDMALNHFNGMFCSTHGRTYDNEKINNYKDHTNSTFNLLFGLNRQGGGMAASSFAVSARYRVPRVIYEIAHAKPEEFQNRQRMGIQIEEAEKWGLDYKKLEDGMTFLSLEAYTHPKTINLMARMLDEYQWWENEFFEPFAKHKGLFKFGKFIGALPLMATILKKDMQRNTRSEVNIYTYRTPYYMLSTAQDYKKGYGGDQQHIWGASLGPEAVCFTTHPVKEGEVKSPSYWVGSGNLPRAAQIKNTAIILYNISTAPGLYITHDLKYTHAWFPKEKFDEVKEDGNWIFAKKGDGYIGLWSKNSTRWADEGKYANKELIAEGKKNIWICELGSKSQNGSFQSFVRDLKEAKIVTSGLGVEFYSPSQGKLEFGWEGDLRNNGMPVALNDYPRYENNFFKTDFPANNLNIEYNGFTLKADYEKGTREVNRFLE